MKKKRRKSKKRRRGQAWGRPPVLDYEQRARLLPMLGFGTYSAYLASPLWEAIRSRVMARDRQRCRLCNDRAPQVHHSAYDLATLRGEDLSRLAAVCAGCHRSIEFDGEGKKRPPAEVAVAFRCRRRRLKAIEYGGALDLMATLDPGEDMAASFRRLFLLMPPPIL